MNRRREKNTKQIIKSSTQNRQDVILQANTYQKLKTEVTESQSNQLFYC